MIEIKNLNIAVEKKEIIADFNLNIKPGEIHVIMGPNGSGKSTLVNSLLGHPKYLLKNGSIIVDGEDIAGLSPDQRAKKGLFLSMQYSPEINGVTLTHFLRVSTSALKGENKNPFEFHEELTTKMEQLNIDRSFATRYINTGFSGGEKKRAEILQLLLLDPKYAILDETDSGLDVDSLKIVSEGINLFMKNNKSLLLITHYNRILEYVQPHFVHIMVKGKIVKTGGKELAKEIEKTGYKQYE